MQSPHHQNVDGYVALMIEREREGRCGSCGITTHKLVPSPQGTQAKEPLTVDGEVLRGRCLLCHPIPTDSLSRTSDDASANDRADVADGASRKRKAEVARSAPEQRSLGREEASPHEANPASKTSGQRRYLTLQKPMKIDNDRAARPHSENKPSGIVQAQDKADPYATDEEAAQETDGSVSVSRGSHKVASTEGSAPANEQTVDLDSSSDAAPTANRTGKAWGKWMPQYKKAKAFHEMHGHLYTKSTTSLGRWLCNQRYDVKRGILCEEKVQLLDALGFDWKSQVKKSGTAKKTRKVANKVASAEGPAPANKQTTESKSTGKSPNGSKNTSATRKQLVAPGIDANLIQKALSSREWRMQEGACKMIRENVNTPEKARAAVKSKGIEMIVRSLNAFRHEQKIQVAVEACWAITKLVWLDSDNSTKIAKAGGIKGIIASIRVQWNEKDEKILLPNAIEALRYLCCDATKEEIVSSRVMADIFDAMKRYPKMQKLHQNGLELAQDLVYDADDENFEKYNEIADKLVRDGAIPALIMSMKVTSKNEDLVLRACEAMRNFTVSDEIRSEMSQSGLLVATIGAMKDAKRIDVRNVACTALHAFVLTEDTDLLSNFAAAGGIRETARAMGDFVEDEEFQVTAILIMKETSVVDESTIGIVSVSRTNALVGSLEAHSDSARVQHAALDALRCCGIKCYTRDSTRIVNAAVKALKGHPEDSNVQEGACWVLKQHSAFREAIDLLKNQLEQREGVVELLMQASSTFPKVCREVANYVIQSIQNFVPYEKDPDAERTHSTEVVSYTDESSGEILL